MPMFIKIERSDTAGCYLESLSKLHDAIDGEWDAEDQLEEGTQITLTVVEMSQEEYDALPEFYGW